MAPSEETCTILVVDDEAAVRRLVARMLESNGYTVHTAANGEEAIELLRKQPECIGLLLTDLSMPNKNGIELIGEVRAIKPELPVVVMSGSLHEYKQELGSITCIAKPFAIDTLFRVVKKQLKSSRAIQEGAVIASKRLLVALD